MKHDKLEPRPTTAAANRATKNAASRPGCANDNDGQLAPQDGDPLILLLAQMDIAATRIW